MITLQLDIIDKIFFIENFDVIIILLFIIVCFRDFIKLIFFGDVFIKIVLFSNFYGLGSSIDRIMDALGWAK